MAVDPLQRTSSDSVSWVAIAALAAAVLGVELASPLAIAVGSLVNLALACLALGAAALFYRRVRVNERLSACCIALIQALLFSALGALLSYLLARGNGAFWDSSFRRWDQDLGLDWLAYARLIDAHAWLVPVLRGGYGSLIPQTVVVILALGFSGRLDQLRMFILAAILSGAVAVLMASLMPAVGPFAYLGLKPGDFAHVWQATGLADLKDFLAVRNGSLTSLDLRKLQGIIVFPSYHGALATIALWGFWKSGLTWLRCIGCVAAAVTIVATPVEGGHYCVDVVAGIGMGVASIAAARHLVFMRLPFGAITASPFRRSREAFAR